MTEEQAIRARSKNPYWKEGKAPTVDIQADIDSFYNQVLKNTYTGIDRGVDHDLPFYKLRCETQLSKINRLEKLCDDLFALLRKGMNP